MPNLQLANGATIKDVLVWDGIKWVSRLVYVRTSNGWEECHRPTQFVDTFTSVSGGTRRSTTGLISSGLKFERKITYTVSKI